jgi:hypothetical protein
MYLNLRIVFFVALATIFALSVFPEDVWAATNIDADVIVDTTWNLSGSPYVVSGPISVAENTTLTIEPGVIVKFLDISSGLYVSGSLHAQGTETQQIYFTSYQDDIGEDTNQDGEDSLPYPGDWDGIILGDYTQSNNILSQVNFRYAGNGIVLAGVGLQAEYFSCSYSEQCFNLTIDASLSLKHFWAGHVSGNIFDLYQSSLTLEDALIVDIEIGSNPFSQHILNGYKSAVSFERVVIESLPTPVVGVTVFGQSSFNASHFSFTTQSNRDAVTIFNDSTVSLTETTIQKTAPEFSESGLLFFNHVAVSLTNVHVFGFAGTGIYDVGSQNGYESNSLVMSRAEVDHNGIGFGIGDGLIVNAIDVSDHDNGYGLFAYTNTLVPFENIWWGSEDGPNYTTIPTGTNNEVFGLVDYTPWAVIDPFNLVPAQYFAKITNIPSGVAKLYETPSTNGVLVKTLPNDWVVKVIQKTLDSGQPAISDGYRWYKVEDPTDGSQMWMFAGPTSGNSTPYLPYNTNLQANLQHISSDILGTKALRRQAILEVIDHYYNDTSVTPSLYSSDDIQTISLLKEIGMPREVLLAIISQESGGNYNFNNEYVSFDYGHGVMQLTFKAWANEAPGYSYTKNNWDNRGKFSRVENFKCRNAVYDSITGAALGGLNEYQKCYLNAGGYNKLNKPYKNYEDIVTNQKYKQYTNTVQSFYANIKDGLGDLRKKYTSTQSCPHPDAVIDGLTFTCEDVRKILMVWAYNGLGYDKQTKQYTGRYLHDISQKLQNLSNDFPGVTYANTDQLIEKLEIANNNKKTIKVYSPVELQVIDSQGNVAGLINGTPEVTIPNSMYDADAESVTILFPNDTYSYKVMGDTTGGSYGLSFSSTQSGVRTDFLATNIPITTGEIHTYHIDEPVLAIGGEGVTLEIDTNGDGVVEETITTDASLTDITPPTVNADALLAEYPLGEKINLKQITTDNESSQNHITFTATWDGNPLIITNGKITLPTIGIHTLTITAIDEVGNSTTVSKQVHVSYIFLGFRPVNFNVGSFKINKPLNIKFRIKAKNGILIPVLAPTLSVVRVSDGYHANVNPNNIAEDPDCDVGDECFANYHNRYKRILPANFLTVGQWIITVGLGDGNIYTATVNVIN